MLQNLEKNIIEEKNIKLANIRVFTMKFFTVFSKECTKFKQCRNALKKKSSKSDVV